MNTKLLITQCLHIDHLIKKNKLDCYRDKYCTEDLKEHETKIISYDKKEMIPLNCEEKKLQKIMM